MNTSTEEITRTISDNRVVIELPLPSKMRRLENFTGAEVDYKEDKITLFVNTGETIIISKILDGPNANPPSPVLYLDQNHWSNISDIYHGLPSRIEDKEELEAYKSIISAILEGKIIVPLSSGHFLETAKISNVSAMRRLFKTMLDLSQGWKQADFLDLICEEISISVFNFFDIETPDQVIRSYTKNENMADFPEILVTEKMRYQPDLETIFLWGFFVAKRYLETYDLFWTSDSEYVKDVVSRFSESWATHFSNRKILMEKMRLAYPNLSPQKTERVSHHHLFQEPAVMNVLNNVSKSLPEAEMIIKWLDYMPTSVQESSAWNIFSQIVSKKLTTRMNWENNDAIDLTMLSIASAYADFVLCERKTSNLLNQKQIKGKKAKVFYKSKDLIHYLSV